jgi:DNA-binding response OmpR family regulator
VQTEEMLMDTSALQPPRAPKVFLVEDDKDISAIYKESLEMQGFSVDYAEDGLRAIKMVKELHPDVIVLDLLMPKLNGVDVVKFVRSHAETATIPIIILSNAFMSDLVQRAADAGANMGLLKSSCTPAKLIAVINNVLAGDQSDTKHMLLAAPLRDKRDGFISAAPEMPKSAPSSLLDQTQERKRSASTEMRHAFTVTEARSITEMRALWQNVLMHEAAAAQKIGLTEIWTKVRAVSASATAAGCVYIARFTNALEALLRDLISDQENINYSRMLAVAEGIDFLQFLFNATGGVNFGSPNPNSLLLVDPDIELAFSLERTVANFNLRLIHATDSATATMWLDRETYDLIVVEADLPDLSGYTFAMRTRALPAHAKTPVYFLTSTLNGDSRPRVLLAGGKEIFGKPILSSEIIVKALMQIMRDEIDAAKPA